MFYKIVIDGTPTHKARPRFTTRGGYPHAYKIASEQCAEDGFKYEAKKQLQKQGLFEPVKKGESIRLSVLYTFGFPKSYSKKKRLELLGDYHIFKPDLDNLLKFHKDGLNGILYTDDCQVCCYGYVIKKWGEFASTVIIAETLNN